ncbi:phage minor capsid protein [Weissella bombi]
MTKVNDDQMLLGASLVGDIYRNMAQELFIRMIKRIKKRGVADLKDNPYLWQLEKLNDMHMLNEENIKYVSQQTGVARKLLDEIIQNEGLSVYQNTAEQIANDLNTATPNYNSVQETLANYAKQTFLDIDNLVNQTLLTTNLGNNSTMNVYKSIVEQSVAEVTTGLKSPDKAISDTVMKWIDKGIPSGFVDKGGHTWSIERYVDTVMTSTTYRVYNEMRTSASEQMGVDTFLMSSHAASRPACAPIQGHVVTKRVDGFHSHDKDVGYVASIYDHEYGEPAGTLGINCRHTLTPFIIGVNSLPDVDIPDPKQTIANGKKQASQRSYERGIRDAKYKLEAAKQLGDDKLAQHYKMLLSNRQLGLRQLIDNNDFLHRDYSRERIYKNQKLVDAYKTQHQAEISKSYKKVSDTLGKHAPSQQEYTEIRKSSKKIHALDKDVKTVNYIKHSARETSDTKIRNKGVDIYYSLKRDGYESSGHAVTRMAERMFKKNGQYNYNYQTIINTLHKKPNFIDSRNGRLVRYYNKIAIITEKDTNYIVTFIKQRKKGNGWTQL